MFTRQLPAPERSRQRLTLLVTGVGFFLVLLDITIVSVALPQIRHDLDLDLGGLSWVVNAYTLPFAVLLLPAGTFADRLGRRGVFAAGLAVFTAGSALCAVATGPASLFAGRALQGAGGAAVSPTSLALIAAAFPDVRERTRAIGVWSSLSGLALAAGPLAGGLLIRASGDWRTVFWVDVPLGVLAVALGLRALPRTSRTVRGRVDLAGLLLSAAALTPTVYALTRGGALGWSSPTVVACLLAGAVSLAAFLAHQARTATPTLPPALFRQRLFSVATTATFLLGFVLTADSFFFSQFFQDVQGHTALGSGLRTLPVTAGIFLAAPVAGRLAARHGHRVPVAAGTSLAAGGLLALTRVAPDSAYATVWWALALVGIGFGLSLGPLVAAVLAASPPERAGTASGANNVARQLGGTIGVAVLTALVGGLDGDGTPASFTAALHPAFAVNAALLAGTGLLVATLLVPPRAAAPTTTPATPSPGAP